MVPADSRRIPRDPRYSGCHLTPSRFTYRTITLCGSTFQMILFAVWISCRDPTTPTVRCHTASLGSSPFARHYWGNHCLFSLPAGTKMFQFPAFASLLSKDDYPSGNRVVPFGNPGVNGHLHLTRAYRSLSRPSSPPRAKASTRRPNFLSPIISSYFQLYSRFHLIYSV